MFRNDAMGTSDVDGGREGIDRFGVFLSESVHYALGAVEFDMLWVRSYEVV